MRESHLRLLALDGGGVRGLSTLQILKQLMDTIDPESPPKPCDYFDMIGGTSTGGLIAIMLGRLRMTVDECIDRYVSLSDRIFQKQRHRVTIKGQVQGRFDSGELERAIKEILTRQGYAEDALLKDAEDAKCKVFVCATSSETGHTVRLTSYRSPRGREQLFRSTKIWEAGRATSAASSFFDPITIGDFGQTFSDGATGANNPVYEVWNEAQDLWPSGSLEDKVKCLVSIGTGVPSLKPFKDNLLSIGHSLLSIATETEKTAEQFSRDKSRLDDMRRYYRFNVSRGLEDIGLEDSKRKSAIIAATDRYIESQAVFKQIKACADVLSERACKS
ncbi:acyl transferase/acyl hydrolase/lysophospholipase [Clohesyomyces aquaticus]|uniref:Acyl transferase/acyl hydrolase/lysophospholipase n=1 Tax=Clohesyomyces aquaticus TaxID=1231657 RepID=A0A1Y2A7A4_9PLEO|nr:acyl transferase/acyl hydrolase/lysophospholipase [Clohesyomyces aquaticus]